VFMEYTEKVIEHFSNPRNVGEIPNADGVGVIGSVECGDVLKVWIKVADEHLVDIKYKVLGCPAAIAACSMMTKLAMGKHIDDASELTDTQVAEALGGLPENKYHCSNLAASVLQKAITNHIFRMHDRENTISITTLVDNNASKNLASEHGLSFWVEYGDKRFLFDTGQTNIIVRNAKLLGVDLTLTDAIIVSHGHYDHTGGLAYVLDVVPKTTIYLHPAALKTKFARRDTNIRDIGMSDLVMNIVRTKVDKKEVVLTEEPTEVSAGLYVTGRIPRVTDFEDIDSSFFVDKYCRDLDELPDDQAMFFDSPKGLVILLGCAHSGVVNTLHYVVKLSGQKQIYAVLGGMHLRNASKGRMERTISVFREYDVQKIGMAHCTGKNAMTQFQRAFPDRCFICSAGTQVNLGDDHNAHIRV